MSHIPELCRLRAQQAVELLARGEVSPLELVESSAACIEMIDPGLNALPTVCFERARDHARRIMREGNARERPRGWLGGLPIAIKDLNDVAGVRTTYGSKIYSDHVPKRSDRLVERLEANGAIVMAKSNTPELGAGTNTFNEVFGKTRNPWDRRKSVSGSSGGSAAAVASGQVWLATGSDLGGSLRVPASFNGVVGLRPSPGRTVRSCASPAFDVLNVEGPLARTASDAALLLDAMTGAHVEDPLCMEAPAEPFAVAIQSMPPPRRIAFSPDLGIVPVDVEIARICAHTAERFTSLRTELTDESPDFSGAFEAMLVLRAAWFVARHEEHLRRHRSELKPEIVWNIEEGLELEASTIKRAETARGDLCQRMGRFFQDHDLLLCPTAIVPPFDVDIRHVQELGGVSFQNYVHWTSITSVITLTGCPALSVPAGLTSEGLPVGLQIVGPPRGEARVLSAAAQLEEAIGFVARLPVIPQDEDASTLIR